MKRTTLDDELTDLVGYPGGDIVGKGIRDLRAGRWTIEAALVASASRRMSALGLTLPDKLSDLAESPDLYRLVEDEVGIERAHGRYNALRRQLTSFLRSYASASTG
jgi:hypothetical protein